MQLNYISKWGELLSLKNNDLFDLINVDNLTWTNSDLSTNTIGGVDGDTVTNIQAQPRPITLDLCFKNSVDVETTKRAITQVIKPRQECTLEWTQNNRTLYIQGVVENIEMARFTNQVIMQVFLHCSDPSWKDINQTVNEINEALALHYFTNNSGDMLYFVDDGIPLGQYDTSRTRTFRNMGDFSVGMIIEVLAYKTVTNPIIYNQNGEYFGVGYGSKPVTMNEGDVLVISTIKGQLSVTLNGRNMLGKVKQNSTWLKLDAGLNEFSINSDDSDVDNMTFTLNYTQGYI